MFRGVVDDGTGPVANAPVALFTTDADAQTRLGPVAAGLTDESGNFALSTPNVAGPSTNLILSANTSGGSLSAFAAALEQDINPITTGSSSIITAILNSPEGRFTSDYTTEEVSEIYAASETALTDATIDLTDSESVRLQLLVDVGRLIAESSGGAISASVATFDSTDGTLTPTDDTEIDIEDSFGELWDLRFENNPYMDNGTSDSYDEAFKLVVDGEAFNTLTVDIEDNSPTLTESTFVFNGDVHPSGLTLTRKIAILETLGVARFVEILTNETDEDITTQVLIESNLGSDESNDIVTASSSGDSAVNAADDWLVNKQDSDPAVGFLFPGAVASKDGDDISYQWDDVLVPVGATVVLTHFGLQDSLGADELVERMLAIEGLPVELIAGFSAEEFRNQLFIIGPNNVLGEAGAIAPGVGVTVTLGDASRTITAKRDGSFSTFFEVEPGDTINLTADDGLDVDLLIE